jgi:hypothetical protein
MNIVIITMTEPLILVKSTLVLLIVKMLGEMKSAQIMVMSIVIVHSMFLLVMELGIVMISITSLLK